MRHVIVAMMLSAIFAAPAWAESQTLQGEVVDPAAFLKDGRHGPEAEDATFEAVDGGQTLALLEEATGGLYLFLAEEPGEDPNELVYDYVNRKVIVKGTLYERGGMRGIVPTSVEPVEPPATAATTPGGLALPATPPAQELPDDGE